MKEIIKLPPYNAITNRSMTKQGHYEQYRIWRQGAGYKLWLKTQWRIQRGCCYYCKVSLLGRQHNVEHVLAQSLWGETKLSNLVLACPDCNKAKGSTKASKELRNNVSWLNHVKRATKKSQKRKWKRF